MIADSIANASIASAWRSLSGGEIKNGRARAFWRGSTDLNISVDVERGIWHDFTTGEGGGVLALVQTVLECDKRAAVEWMEGQGLIPSRTLTPEEKAKYSSQQRDIESNLPSARLWRRAAIGIYSEVMDELKTALFDPALPRPEPGDIREIENLLALLRKAEGTELVNLYRAWLSRSPATTIEMVRVAAAREKAEKQALAQFLWKKAA